MGRHGLKLRGNVKRGVMRMTRRDYNKWNNIGGGGYIDPVPDFLFHYRLDGNDSALTPINSPSIVAGLDLPDELASNFNGVDQRYSSSDLALTGINGGALSLVVRFNTRTTSTNQATFSTGNGSSPNNFRVRNTTGAKFQFRTGSSNLQGDPTLTADTWYHAVVTITGSGGTAYVYMDGVASSPLGAPTYNWDGSGFLQVGATLGSQPFNGEIDEVRFYDRVLTPAEVTALYNNIKKWTPADITTLGWYDPSDTDTITSSGGLVSQLDDIGTSSTEHLVQSTGSKQMSTGLQTINGLNVLSSTTTTRLMENLTFPVPASGNLSVAFVAKIDGQTPTTSSSLISMDAVNDWQINSNNATQFNGALNANIGSFDPMSGGPFTGPDVWSVVFNFDGGIKKVFVNGVERSSGTYTTAMDTVQKLRIFANRGGANPIFGLFGEMIITEDVSDATRQLMENYLTDKWMP